MISCFLIVIYISLLGNDGSPGSSLGTDDCDLEERTVILVGSLVQRGQAGRLVQGGN